MYFYILLVICGSLSALLLDDEFSSLSTKKSELIKQLVNPFMGYFICDYYLDIVNASSEVPCFADFSPPSAAKLSTPGDIGKITMGESLYVQIMYR